MKMKPRTPRPAESAPSPEARRSTQAPATREEIVALAARRWQEAGSPPGRDREFWLAAESELKLQRASVEQTIRGQAHPAPGTP